MKQTLNNKYPLLSTIHSPAELKLLSLEQLPLICGEIRRYLIENLSVNPGHFGSSMGAVDIIVAIHYVFNTPYDRVVYDVGHQAYAHKILTGRFEAFSGQRTLGGISGFPFPAESEYDTFVCGHAGNSISAALGMSIADSLSPKHNNRKTVALIGDASISSGLAFEGLNNASQHPNNLLIILNDNNMSIDKNVGALHRYLSDISTSARYNKVRFKIYSQLRKMGLINDKGKGLMLRFNNALKSLVAKQQNIFEGLNIRYFGPFNGNDVIKIVKVLRDIKDMKGPRILHLHTIKGKGYEAAEKDPAPWHAPGKFNPDTAERTATKSLTSAPLWQEVFGETLTELAEKNDNIVAVTAAMPSGTSVNKMEKYPERMFDTGISEGHAVTFAGGLATAGKKPFVAIYSSFLQRAYDNIIHDVAIQGLPVVLCIDRAGIVGEDGVTHHGLFDITYLRIIPGMTSATPMDAETLRSLMATAAEMRTPMAIRYPRGKCLWGDPDSPLIPAEPGKGRIIAEHPDARIAVMSVGSCGNDVKEALAELEMHGIKADHYDMIWIKPLDETLLERASRFDTVITVEDGIVSGGFGSAVSEWMESHNKRVKVRKLGVPDRWVYHGSPEQLKEICGYDKKGIIRAVKEETKLTAIKATFPKMKPKE
ncbi:MAG: 1-deoxy-D-xylulose-5-phosphate synthase [Candidatus Amulumruptor caecigallinarius]|nr:1-deoxy-D-xylulose-5-phosphate synthase [Candidatus Amulumruptor caecigallinarius]